MTEADSTIDPSETALASPTPLASLAPAHRQVSFAGRQTVSVFSDAAHELAALCSKEGSSAGLYDLGWRT